MALKLQNTASCVYSQKPLHPSLAVSGQTEFRDLCQWRMEWMFLILSFLALNREKEAIYSVVRGPSAHTSTSFGLLLSLHTMAATKAPQYLLSTEVLPPVKFSTLSHLERQNTKQPFFFSFLKLGEEKRMSNTWLANNY